MSLSDLAIKLRISVLVLIAVATVAGAVAYVTLPKESNPSISIPNIVVTTIYPGASPDDVESLITQVIEQEVQGITGIEEIRSTSTEGVSTIIVEFGPKVQMEEANQRVRDKVDLAKPKLPTDVEEPMINEIDFSDFPIMNVNLAAPYPLTRLKEVAEDLQDDLESIPSVLEVILVGGIEREVQVDVRLSDLQGYNLGFQDLIDTVARENVNIPGGSIDVEHLNYLVRVDGQIKDPAEIPHFGIKAVNGQAIRVRDVADVRFGFKKRASHSRLRLLQRKGSDGKLERVEQADYGKVITLSVKKRSGDNILDTAAEVRAAIAKFDMPSNTQVLITGDQSEQVEDLVKDLENNILSGLVFVVAVLFFFLGTRTSLLVGVAIPLSMLVSFIVFQAMGQTLNFIILFSLIIALGMLVDNAIVLVENIYRFIEEGHKPFEAARLGAKEVGGAVIASTATTVAVFVPMMFWPGMIGEFMGYMPFTLIVTLSSSLFVALIMNPVLTGYFARNEDEEHPKMTRPTKVVIVITVGLLAALVGAANMNTLIVLGVGGVGTWIAVKLVLQPTADWIMQRGLPALVEKYREFLRAMLARDYTRRWAIGRNIFALTCLALGATLGIIGGLAAAAVGQMGALPILGPAALFGALGAAGVLIHSLEVCIAGRGKTMIAGIVLGAMMAGILGAMYLGGNPASPALQTQLMALPVVLFVLGGVGLIVLRRARWLILTDNRARLLNVTLGGLVAIVMLFAMAPTGVEFFPNTDPNQVSVSVKGRIGTNLEASNALATTVQGRVDALLESQAKSKANVKNVLVNVGVGGDSQFGGGSASPEQSTVSLNLARFEHRSESSAKTLVKIRDQLAGIAGADIEIKRDQAGPPTGPPVNIEISGPKFEKIVAISERIKARMEEANVPGLVDIRDNLNSGRPELSVRIKRDRAADFGLDARLIGNLVRTANNGAEAGKWRDGKDEYDITVRLAEEDRRDLDSLKNLTVFKKGQQIPLVAVADFDVGGGLGSITRKDLERVVTVQGNANEGVNAQALLMQVKKVLEPVLADLPTGYTVKFTGESEDQAKSFGFLTKALGAGVALIMMVLIAQFNSVSLPFIIMLAVGLSMIGVLLGLMLTRTPFGLFTFIGIISLAGIVVNNNIVLIDYIEQLRKRSIDKQTAIIEGGATRLRPVLLTAMTTVLGLIPLTFGINIDFVGLLTEIEPDFRIGSANTQFWGPMGTSIISGLTFATFLTLVIVPVMYSVFDSMSRWTMGVFGRKPAADAEGDAAEDADASGPEATPEPAAT